MNKNNNPGKGQELKTFPELRRSKRLANIRARMEVSLASKRLEPHRPEQKSNPVQLWPNSLRATIRKQHSSQTERKSALIRKADTINELPKSTDIPHIKKTVRIAPMVKVLGTSEEIPCNTNGKDTRGGNGIRRLNGKKKPQVMKTESPRRPSVWKIEVETMPKVTQVKSPHSRRGFGEDPFWDSTVRNYDSNNGQKNHIASLCRAMETIIEEDVDENKSYAEMNERKLLYEWPDAGSSSIFTTEYKPEVHKDYPIVPAYDRAIECNPEDKRGLP